MGAEYEQGALAQRLAPEVLSALAAIGRVGRALVGPGTLTQLGERTLAEMRESLDLPIAVLYLSAPDEPHVLHRYVTCADSSAEVTARDELRFDDEAWRLASVGGAPLVFQEPASWLAENPFEPPAESWLLLPLVLRRQMVGIVAAAARQPLALGPTGATLLTLLGDLLSAGIGTARLRQEAKRAEVQRERLRLAADVHDGLAQDLSLATREMALLDSDPPAEVARASQARLREAIASAHRVVRARLEDLSVSVPLGGIDAAVEQVCERFRARGLPLRVVREGPAVDIPAETAAAVLRVVTEALSNVERHAVAEHVEVAVRVEAGQLVVVVEDDGRGFSVGDVEGPGDGHFGLSLMQKRAEAVGGALAVLSKDGGGTRVTLQLPLH